MSHGSGRPWTAYPPDLAASRVLSEAEREACRAAFFAGRDMADELWLFAYGSLIWKPELRVSEQAIARVHGYHRGLYLWSRVSRGTPQRPGLVMALDCGGSCLGVALRLAGGDLEQQLATLWRREMPMESYRPVWLSCRLADGRRVRAFSFAICRQLSCYAGRLAPEVLHHVLAQAHGAHGSSYDYLAQTVLALRQHRIRDRALEALWRRCPPPAAPAPHHPT